MIRQVSSTLLSPTDKLKIQLSVGLVDSSNNPSYCSMYTSANGAGYLNITPMPSIVLRYSEKNRPWSKMDNIYITQRNIFAVKEDLKSFYSNLMNQADDIFQYGQSGYIVAMGNVEQYKQVTALSPTQILKLSPTTIYGSNGRPLPGVAMEINLPENLVELSMDEFESVYNLFQTIQLHQEGLLLLQAYMITCLKGGELKIPVEQDRKTNYTPSEKDVRVNIFESAQKKREQTEMVSGPGNIKQPTTLEELQ